MQVDSVSFGDLIGIPYVPYGRDPREGLDCYTLVLLVGQRLGINYPLPSYSLELADRHVQANNTRHLLTRVDVPELGDIIAIRIGRFVAHFGVMLTPYRFIHATEKTGVVVSSTDSPIYSCRIEGYYRCNNN